MKPSCPVCLSSNTRWRYEITRFKPSFHVHLCQSCHCLFQYPQPSNPFGYYHEGYYAGHAPYAYQDERKQYEYHKHVHEARLQTLLKYLPPSLHGGKFLDVGCGFGGFALSASRYFKAYGLDVSAYAINEGKKWLQSYSTDKSVRLFRGSLTQLPKNKELRGGFAVISLVEVAEHLPTPRQDFQAAYQLLLPGGILLVQTANFSAWQAILAGEKYHYFLPGHLVYYTSEGLKNMLKQIGFRHFVEFFPVDFSLMAKWRKARGNWKNFLDWRHALRIGYYHIISRFEFGGRRLTSSYVLYAIR
ncbi:MAG: class I SAM-dependent methyltransferase [Leptospiraceae bacterium]|nr:class I SAM-dependent methyltransferase [Leptospiraceae bacterium]MDW8305848.1 class I SAM-dependent methyltransferase [Leptospiraceae bacterium]